jgi:hypothetical protein
MVASPRELGESLRLEPAIHHVDRFASAFVAYLSGWLKSSTSAVSVDNLSRPAAIPPTR